MAFAGDLRSGHGNTDAAERSYSAQATLCFWRGSIMPTAEQCNAYAGEYQLLGQQVGVSIRRAATLMAISQSWTILADQLERLAEIAKDESK